MTRILQLFAFAASVLALSASEHLQGAALLKTDLMFVGAHPDDETGVAATLARYAGQGKTVACVYVTRGEGGGNMVGTQAGAALGILREAELRRCLEKLGVRLVYFLDEEDFFYTESLAASLDKWGKPDVLGKLVRVVRALRPDVIVTMNPAPNPGQHGHHQAAGILATEAFSAAARADAFPEQLEREGLEPWQVRKLYFGIGSDRSVRIRTDEPLPNGKIPADLAAIALSEHRSQAFGNIGNSPWLRRPQSFLLARAAVRPNSPEADLLESLDKPLSAISLETAMPAPRLRFVPRPAIVRFLDWAREHQVLHTASEFPADLPVIAGMTNNIPLEADSLDQHTISREDWRIVSAHRTNISIAVPASAREDVELVAKNTSGAEARVRLHPVPSTTVLSTFSSRPGLAPLAIGTNLLVQGRVDSKEDCSAVASLTYTPNELKILVNVTDDVVVSNIAPNDIKGHWRSDSVEICLDPNPGSEHTMNTFKLGVFPFDSAGKVRAARDADANQGPVERTAPDIQLHSERTATGYSVLVTIPWKYIGVTPESGRMLGFNIIIYDGDKKDAAPGENINEARLAWSPRPGVQGRPEDWGRLILE